MKKLILLFVFLLISLSIYSQNPEWINYTSGQQVISLVIEGDIVWIGKKAGGMVKLNKITGKNIFFNKSNSGLPSNSVYALAIDGSENKWIGTDGIRATGGLACLRQDGTNWTVYNTFNSGLPNNSVLSLAIDGSGNKWIGTWVGGLAKFNGTNWTVYDTSNSGLPSNSVHSLAIDGSGNKWIGTWVSGLAKFNGTNWTVYNTSNSGLPSNVVRSLAIDGSGNKWIGTDGGGLAVYKEGGVVSVEEKNLSTPADYLLSQNYPNPFNPSTTIEFSIPHPAPITLKVYDVLGREVATLVNEPKSAGKHMVEWNAGNLPSGVYIYRLDAGSFSDIKKMILMK